MNLFQDSTWDCKRGFRGAVRPVQVACGQSEVAESNGTSKILRLSQQQDSSGGIRTLQSVSTQLCKYSGLDEVQLAELCRRLLSTVFRPLVKSQSFPQAWPSPTSVPILNFKQY